jgi:hypothetical protein
MNIKVATYTLCSIFFFSFTNHALCPGLNTPVTRFTKVAAHLKVCLAMLGVTCEQAEKIGDVSASATYVITGLGEERKNKSHSAQSHTTRGAKERFHGRPDVH